MAGEEQVDIVLTATEDGKAEVSQDLTADEAHEAGAKRTKLVASLWLTFEGLTLGEMIRFVKTAVALGADYDDEIALSYPPEGFDAHPQGLEAIVGIEPHVHETLLNGFEI